MKKICRICRKYVEKYVYRKDVEYEEESKDVSHLGFRTDNKIEMSNYF